MAAATSVCATCGTEASRPSARFCDACGSPIAGSSHQAEFKQVTVLFADVVHSMDIAASVGAERLREIMADLVDRSSVLVRRYGGSVEQFTGDGLMAVFGAPVALEDHAVRACRAALDIEDAVRSLAVDVELRDHVDLKLRVGLNSGQVIAGDFGSGTFGYKAIGEQVGMAQRMESVAPPGGVVVSESTARLVEHAAVLSSQELLRVKGFADALPTRRLLRMRRDQRHFVRRDTALVGRQLELASLVGRLEHAVAGSGSVVEVVGDAGIGKSRLIREVATTAEREGVAVFSTYCASHAAGMAFQAAAELLRDMFGISEVDGDVARQRVRAQLSGANEVDLALVEDLLGIREPTVAAPVLDPDASRRRITATISNFALSRSTPGVYLIEDVHWIDPVSEAILADLVADLRQTGALVLVTARPHYRGALEPPIAADRIVLAPLDAAQSAVLLTELLGSHPSVAGLAAQIGERAAGSPFFTEELVRDLAERDLLQGERGAYTCTGTATGVAVPATVQATISARIDRLGQSAKRTLNAASVIGSRFPTAFLGDVLDTVALQELIDADLIVAAAAGSLDECEFQHPLIRAVAYESLPKSTRAQLHQRVAEAIQRSEPDALDENAELIAHHLEGAEDMRSAYSWCMRAGTWLSNLDIVAARVCWRRADGLAARGWADGPEQVSMRIAPSALQWGTSYRVGGTVDPADFDDLRELCSVSGDRISLAMGMSGLLVSLTLNLRLAELDGLADEYSRLLESIGDPAMIVGFINTAAQPKLVAGNNAEALRLAQRGIDLADGDVTKGNFFFESPLAWGRTLRGLARCSLGIPGWRDDFHIGSEMARTVGGITQTVVAAYGYAVAVINGVIIPDAEIVRDSSVALTNAERLSDNVTLAWARVGQGLIEAHLDNADLDAATELLQRGREDARRHGDRLTETLADAALAECEANRGDLDSAIELSRGLLARLHACGERLIRSPVTVVLVESLIHRGGSGDVEEARAVINELAVAPSEPTHVLSDLPLLRLQALLAHADGDDDAHRRLVDRYSAWAASLGFEGHRLIAEAMTT